eukprot:11661527-Karenia_brevis.AAC.1
MAVPVFHSSILGFRIIGVESGLTVPVRDLVHHRRWVAKAKTSDGRIRRFPAIMDEIRALPNMSPQ